MVSAYVLFLNYNTPYLHFRTKNKELILDMKLSYNNKFVDTMLHTKFLGIIMDGTLQWKAHIDSLLTKISAACYTPRTLKTIMSHTTWISYGLFFLFPLDYVLWHNFLGCFTFSD